MQHFLDKFADLQSPLAAGLQARSESTSSSSPAATTAQTRGSAMHVSQGAMRALMAYAWPGNVRQLENAIERAVALSAGRQQIDVADLPPEVQVTPEPLTAPVVDFPDDGLDLPAYLSTIERDLIRRSLERTGGNRNKAAELLKIKRTTLVEKLKRIENL